MNVKFAAYIAVVLLVIKLSKSQRRLPQCRKVDKTKFPVCVNDGFIRTSVYLANDMYGYSVIMKKITSKLGSCSNYTSFILCSLYVPRCKEDIAKPLLPCRDVCEEFVRGCGERMDTSGLNWLKPLCSLLKTNETDPSCLRPTGFKPSDKPPLSKYAIITDTKVNNTVTSQYVINSRRDLMTAEAGKTDKITS